MYTLGNLQSEDYIVSPPNMVYVTTVPCKNLDHDLFHVKFYSLLQEVQFLLR